MSTPIVQLGDEVQDTITGFKGIAVAQHQYITGCRRISVQPKCDKDGKVPEAQNFDEPLLKVTKPVKPKVEEKFVEARKTGGPRTGENKVFNK